jgi:transmembrane sensor
MRSNPMATERISREDAESAAAAWIARRDTPSWDAKAFEGWLAESVSHRVAYYRLNAAWQEAGRLRILPCVDPATIEAPVDSSGADSPAISAPDLVNFSEGVQALAGRSARQPRPFALRTPWVLAASVLLGFGITMTAYRLERAPRERFSTVVGGLEAVPLADGSRVTLNTDSELQVSLEPRERVVSLDRGEAYFEVAKDKIRPFIVNVGPKRVIAVGTQFSVRRDGDSIQVIVTEGTVRMEDRRARASRASTETPPSAQTATSAQTSPTAQSAQAPTSTQTPAFAQAATSSSVPGSAEPVPQGSPASLGSAGSAYVVLLPAGSVARAEADAVLVRNEPLTEIEQHLSWRSGLLTFRDTPLADAVAEFNRYNERKILIEDPRIANLQLGGIFRSTNIDPFIQLLEQGFPVRATQEGNRILLTHN